MHALVLVGILSAGPAPGWNSHPNATIYAAFSMLDPAQTDSVNVVPGPVLKRGMVFPANNKDGHRPWEHDVNNGYSNVLYDAEDVFTPFRAYYSAGDPSFGGAIPGESSGSATLYATSRDGYHWEKPDLGRYNYHNSTHNNILFDGTTAVGIYDDKWHDRNASRRFKVWGNLPGDKWQGGSTNLADVLNGLPPAGKPSQLAGSAVSANGLNWTDYRRLQGTTTARDTLRFDAMANFFFDQNKQRYVGTDRAFRPCTICGACPIWWQPHGGCEGHISKTCTPQQCNATVRAIGGTITNSDDFQTTTWGPNTEIQANHTFPLQQLYSQVTWPFYNIYLGVVMVFDAVDTPNQFGQGKVHCELAWTADPFAREFVRFWPGHDYIPLGHLPADLAPGPTNSFDSHICFAAAHPVKLPNETRMYYMGGDGPHYSPPKGPLHRNSSFGLATIRSDGFVAVSPRSLSLEANKIHVPATARTRTLPLTVNGSKVILTADSAPAGSVNVRVLHTNLPDGVSTCVAIAGRNVTNEILAGCDLTSIVGVPDAYIEFELIDAALYTFGFILL